MKAGIESQSEFSEEPLPFSVFFAPFEPFPLVPFEDLARCGFMPFLTNAACPKSVADLFKWSSGNPEAITVTLTSPFFNLSS